MTTAKEKLVVRVSLGAATASGADLAEPKTEQHWHWRRIWGVSLACGAAALLLYGWLNVESPEVDLSGTAAPAVVVESATESFETVTPELVLELAPQESLSAPAQPEPLSQPSDFSRNAAVVNQPNPQPELSMQTDAAQPKVEIESRPQPDTVLFKSATGTLRLVILTDQIPSAKASGFSGRVDAATVPQLALYSEVQGFNGQSIEHLWYYEGKLMTRIKLPVKLDYWRTYSRKEFEPSQKGEWRVEILDPQQNLLFSHHFHYQ